MTLFSLLESLFFMSLALSFFLIFLMVYHFKKRMDALDQKTETLGDIFKTLLKEIEYVKEMKPVPAAPPQQLPTFFPQQEFNPLEDFFRQMADARQCHNPDPLDLGIYTDEVIHDVEILSDAVSLDDDEDEDEIEITSIVEQDETVLNQVVEELEYDADALQTEFTIEPEAESEEKHDDEKEEIPFFKEYAEYDESIITEEPLEESVLTEPDRQLSRRALKKMNVQMLRALALREGLALDTSKMKKKELIELLNDDSPTNNSNV